MNGQFCPKCGVSVGADDVFCHKCGNELDTSPAGADLEDGERKTCSMCGSHVGDGDRFCGKCGGDQSAPVFNTRIKTKKRSMPTGVTTHRRKQNRAFRIMAAMVFWGILIGGCYAAYRFFARDVRWSEVWAVVTGYRLDSGVESNLPVEGDEFPDSGNRLIEPLPPIAPEPASQDATPDIGPVPEARPAWSGPDSGGYSVIAIQGEAGTEDLASSGMSFIGVVSGSRVRLREEPNTKSRILGQFDRGKELDVTGRYSSGSENYPWFQVSSGDVSGWMYGEYLRVSED
jgi:hypothetical protein